MLPLIFLVVGILAQQTFAEEPEAIVGGEPAAPGEFPHQVSLKLDDSHICGGSIIDSLWILTAAHCVDDNAYPPYTNFKIATGSISRTGGELHTVEKVIVHEGYSDDMTSSNDIALIKLKTPIQFNNKQSPIPLTDSQPRVGQQCTLSGWGRTSTNGPASDQLLKMNQAVVSQSACQRSLAVRLFGGHLCTLNGYGIGACMGDSGGPLISDGKQVGITSWGVPCAQDAPDVYTNLYFYLDWIRNHIRSSL